MNADRTEEEVGFQIGYERATYGFCRQDLAALGEREVRYNLNSGKYGHDGIPVFHFVSAWLKDAEFERVEAAAAADARAEAREDRMLSIASDALSIAKEDLSIARSSAESARLQARWAVWAAIIATVAAIVATFKE